MDTIIIPRAYLYTDVAEHVIVLLKVRLAELMDLMDPKLYRKYGTTYNNGGAMVKMKFTKVSIWFLKERDYVLQEVSNRFVKMWV